MLHVQCVGPEAGIGMFKDICLETKGERAKKWNPVITSGKK